MAPHSLQPAAPCTISIATSLVASVAEEDPLRNADAPLAGTIASRKGKATVAPMPLRTSRRDMCLPVTNSILRLLDAVAAPGKASAGRRSPPHDPVAPSSTTGSARLMRNAGLFTTPRMNDDMR